MAASTDARTVLVDALNDAGLTAYGYTPPTVIPPVVCVEPDDPWMTPTRIGPRLAAGLGMQVVAIVNLIDSESAIGQLEQLVEDVLAAIPDGFRVGEVGRPTVESSGSQGSTLTASLSLTAHITEG